MWNICFLFLYCCPVAMPFPLEKLKQIKMDKRNRVLSDHTLPQQLHLIASLQFNQTFSPVIIILKIHIYLGFWFRRFQSMLLAMLFGGRVESMTESRLFSSWRHWLYLRIHPSVEHSHLPVIGSADWGPRLQPISF